MKLNKNLLLLLILMTPLLACAQHKKGLNKFFSPLEKPSDKGDGPTTTKEWRPIVNIPALKIVETNRVDAEVDALLLTSTGGGISWQKLKVKNKKWVSTFSFSPATILLSGNLASDNPIDLSYATTVGFFNNTVMFGAGYDLGSVQGRSRFFGLVSVGLNLNN